MRTFLPALKHTTGGDVDPRTARLLWLLRTIGLGVLLALGLALLLQQIFKVSQVATDFCQDYIAASRLAHGLPVYQPLHLWPGYRSCAMPLEYDAHPPPSVLLFLPFGWLAKVPAGLLWGLVCLAAYLLSGALLLKQLGWYSLAGLALFVMGSIFWAPAIGGEEAQNLAQVLTLLLVGAWLLEQSGHEGWAGALLGLAGLLKVWPLVLLVGALAQRRWRVMVVGGLTVLAGATLALVVLGPGAYLAYLGPVQQEERAWVPTEGNISLVGALMRPFSGDPSLLPPLFPGLSAGQALVLSEALAGLALVGALALIWWARRHVSAALHHLLSWGILVTALLLTFPLTWHWGLITLLLPGALLLLALRQLPRPPRWWWAVLCASLLLLLLPQAWLLALTGWLIEQQSSHLLGLEMLLLLLPTLGLALFAAVQAWLLWWACTPRHLDARAPALHTARSKAVPPA